MICKGCTKKAIFVFLKRSLHKQKLFSRLFFAIESDLEDILLQDHEQRFQCSISFLALKQVPIADILHIDKIRYD